MASSNQSIAVFDPDAFYPFRAVVEGPLTALAELQDAERFARMLVLHDLSIMETEPWPDPGVEDEEDGARNVIVGIGPAIGSFGPLLRSVSEVEDLPDLAGELSPRVLHACRSISGAEAGNPYYRAHEDFFRRTLGVIDAGGSAVLAGDVAAQSGLFDDSRYPEALFAELDAESQVIVRELVDGTLGPNLPPVLAMALRRARSRNDLLRVFAEIRDEWGDARRKVWKLVKELRSAKDLAGATEVRKELEAAGREFNPDSRVSPSTLRVMWDVLGGAVVGAGVSGLTAGDVTHGALIGAGSAIAGIVQDDAFRPFRRMLRTGGFDLARRVRTEVEKLDPESPKLLTSILTETERRSLGL